MRKIFSIIFVLFGAASVAESHEHTELNRELNMLTDRDVLFEDYYWLIMHGAFASERYKVALVFGDYDNRASCLEFAIVLQRRNERRRYSCELAPR